MSKLVLLSTAVASVAAAPIKLSALNIEGAPTLSGLSSGGFMAVQLHVAYSGTFNGTAVYAAGPYYCAESSLTYATEKCMYNLLGGPDLTKIYSYTADQVTKGTIDPTSNLADDKVFIYSGTKDSVVNPKVVQDLETFYAKYTSASNIVSNFKTVSQHCIPSLNYGEPCSQLKSPYIGNCAYDGAGAGLQQILGTLNKAGTAVAANLKEFDQTDFYTGDGKAVSLDDTGFVYIPTACANGAACRLHVSLHGCSQEQASIGNDWANHAGFNTWAESNNIVVVYPYAMANQALSNPNGCWDWWGYTNASPKDVTYTLKSGTQMKFIKAIVDTVRGI